MAKKAIAKYTQDLDDQCYAYGNKRWRISRLIKLSEDLIPFDIPLKHFNIFNLHPKSSTTMEFVDDVKRINLADLTKPIILDDEGYCMDGRHRVIKALLDNKESIKAVRFDKTPPHCFIHESDKS